MKLEVYSKGAVVHCKDELGGPLTGTVEAIRWTSWGDADYQIDLGGWCYWFAASAVTAPADTPTTTLTYGD